jgi:hypothetical protein
MIRKDSEPGMRPDAPSRGLRYPKSGKYSAFVNRSTQTGGRRVAVVAYPANEGVHGLENVFGLSPQRLSRIESKSSSAHHPHDHRFKVLLQASNATNH